MGLPEDIEWISEVLKQSNVLEVLDHSDILPLQGTKKYYRSYFEVTKKINNTPENEE